MGNRDYCDIFTGLYNLDYSVQQEKEKKKTGYSQTKIVTRLQKLTNFDQYAILNALS